MAGELLRPGVEVIQTFQSAAPSFASPTLAPVVVGPAFEVINILTSDGTVNSKAKYGTYLQIGKTITQSAFPDPRGNIDELDILDDTVRPFMVAGGNINELLMNPGESFLATSHASARAAIQTLSFGGGLVLGGKVLVLAIDQPARLDTTADITITFTGGTLTAQQACDQINAEVGSLVATVVNTDHVQISSLKYGALSSVTVRSGASANSTLGIGYNVSGTTQEEERVEGSGYRGQDQNNNTTQTPWIEFYQGNWIVNGTSTSFDPKAGLINTETQTFVSAKAAAITFGDTNTIAIHIGDYIFADGSKVKNGEIMKVEPTRFKVGTINTALSTADDNGRYITKVYDTQSVGTIFDDAPFAPKYVWYKATGLQAATAVPVAASVAGATSGSAATQGSVTGVSATFPALLTGLKLHYIVTVDGVDTEGNFTFTNSFATISDLVAAIGTNIPGVTALSSGGQLELQTLKFGRLQAVNVKADGSANATLGFSTSADTVSTGADVEFKNIPAMITSASQSVPTTALTGTVLSVGYSTDGGLTYGTTLTHTFGGELATVALIVSALQGDGAFTGGVLQVVNNGTTFSIKTILGGDLIAIRINSGSTSNGVNKLALTNLTVNIGEEDISGLALSFTFDKNPHIYVASFSDDSLDEAVDTINLLVGATVAAKSGSSDDKLTLTSPLAGSASNVTVLAGQAQIAFGLSTSPATGSARPFPDAYIDDSSNLVIGSEILRDQVTGYPLDFSFDFGTLYIQFKALRLDVTAVAAVAGVLRIPDVDTLSTVLDPVTEDNPLSLGLFLCMLNCPGFEVKGLGIDEINAAAPEGTALAYARAAGLLEAEEVYAIAPLTQDEVITGLWRTHVVAMSDPTQGGERIVFYNNVIPTTAVPGIGASGTQANSTATTNQLLLDVNPAPGLVALGLNPADPFTVAMGVYIELDVGDDFRRYNVAGVTGALANLNVTFTAGQNDDAFYTTTPLTETVINAAWSLKVRGASLIIPGSNPPRLDYSLVANNVAEANSEILNRRAFSVFPDTIKTVINGIEKSLPGYYACAAIAGMVAGQPPQQPFTNFPITGLTGVVGTEKFTKSQANIMAGGGTYILIQDVQGGPVVSRMQLSTDLTSIETRELSITKVVDFTAKFLRLGVRKFIGTQIINNQLLDTIGTTLQGMLSFLIESGVLNGANINNIIQDETAPDTVLVDITLDVPFPCNYIRVTLVV